MAMHSGKEEWHIIIHSEMSQSKLSLSSCMWKWKDSTCYVAPLTYDEQQLEEKKLQLAGSEEVWYPLAFLLVAVMWWGELLDVWKLAIKIFSRKLKKNMFYWRLCVCNMNNNFGKLILPTKNQYVHQNVHTHTHTPLDALEGAARHVNDATCWSSHSSYKTFADTFKETRCSLLLSSCMYTCTRTHTHV